MSTENQTKDYGNERFEFLLFINDNLICKRNFKIHNFIESSMNSINFKETVDHIVNVINEDLKSKSRVYTWYYSDFFKDFNDFPLNPWECTFKFIVTDNGETVISKIWDGYAYPKAIRDRVDIANKTVRITAKDGTVYTYDKDTYFKENEGKLSTEVYILKSMINDKPDLLSYIVKKFCEVCSPREDLYTSISDYTVSELYKTKLIEFDKDGKPRVDKNGAYITKNGEHKKYFYSRQLTYNKWVSDWAKSVSDKTKKYFDELADFEKTIKKYS